jgi:hypothetical protein
VGGRRPRLACFRPTSCQGPSLAQLRRRGRRKVPVRAGRRPHDVRLRPKDQCGDPAAYQAPFRSAEEVAHPVRSPLSIRSHPPPTVVLPLPPTHSFGAYHRYEGRNALGALDDTVAMHEGELTKQAIERASKGLITKLVRSRSHQPAEDRRHCTRARARRPPLPPHRLPHKPLSSLRVVACRVPFCTWCSSAGLR